MSGYIGDDVVASWLQSLAGQARYISLHFDYPTWADPSASEVFDPGYARQRISWESEGSRGIHNALALTFPAVSDMNVAALGMWTDAVGGTFVAWAEPLPGEIIYIDAVEALVIPALQIAVRIP